MPESLLLSGCLSPFRVLGLGRLTLKHHLDFRPRSVGIARRPTAGTNQTNLLTQTFVDPEREAKYRLHRDATAVYNLLALPLALTWLAFFALATSSWYVVWHCWIFEWMIGHAECLLSPFFFFFFPIRRQESSICSFPSRDCWTAVAGCCWSGRHVGELRMFL